MKLSIKLTIVAFIFAAFTFQTQAQSSCARVLKSKTGKVYSANPGVLSAVATSNQVTVRVRKTGGKAETQINILVNGQMQPNPMEYDNGNLIPSGWKTRTINNANGKTIKVQIVNQSVANTFSYEAKIEGMSGNITTTGAPVTGTLYGQTNKTIYTNASCTGKARIIVRRTSGKARGNIRVWEKVGSSWNLKNGAGEMLEQNEANDIFVVNSSRPLKIELRNVSVGNKVGYKMNAVAAD